MAHSVWTGGSRYTGQAALPHKNIHVVDCAKWKVLEIRRYTVFKNAEYLNKVDLAVIRQNWEDTDYPVVIWSNKKLGKKIDEHLKWRALYFKGE